MRRLRVIDDGRERRDYVVIIISLWCVFHATITKRRFKNSLVSYKRIILI